MENVNVEEIKEEKNVIKLSKFEIKMLFNPVLDGVKLTGVSKEDRISLIKLKIELGKIAKELEEFEKVVIESFKDDNYKSLEQEASKEDATEEDKENFKKLQEEVNKKINESCIEEYNKEVCIECDPISSETFFNVISTVDLTALGGYEYIYNKLVKE